MKTKILIAFAFVSLLFSCSSDDSDSGSANYLSLNDANYWKYNVSLDGTASGQDHLFVGNDTIIGTSTYKIMKTMEQPLGFFSNSLRHNGLKNDGASIKMTGNLGINLGAALPINIPVVDFVIFKEDATNNQELSNIEGLIEQTVGTFPLKINYIVSSTALETLPSFTTPAPDSKVYTNVIKIKTVMNMAVTTQQIVFGFPVDVPVMNAQDVVVSTQYYSKNIGMVYANTTINYNLNTLPGGATLPFPSTGTQVQDEFLDSYSVQ